MAQQNPDARSSDDEQDRIWLVLVAQGGRQAEKAVEALFRRYRGSLLGFLMRRGISTENAEELVQETFIRMVKGATGFRHDARVSSWLFQIAKNLHIDQTRKNTPESTMDETQWLVVESTVAANDSMQAESRAAQSLQDCYDLAFARFAREFPERAEALQCVVKDNWAIRDVAKFLSRTEGATREYLSQCKKKLKDYLEPCRRFLSEV